MPGGGGSGPGGVGLGGAGTGTGTPGLGVPGGVGSGSGGVGLGGASGPASPVVGTSPSQAPGLQPGGLAGVARPSPGPTGGGASGIGGLGGASSPTPSGTTASPLGGPSGIASSGMTATGSAAGGSAAVGSGTNGSREQPNSPTIFPGPPRDTPPTTSRRAPPADGIASEPLRPGEWTPPPRRTRTLPRINTTGRNPGSWPTPEARTGDCATRPSAPPPLRGHPAGLLCRSLGALRRRRADQRDNSLGCAEDDSVDALVSAIWRQMESWGIAGRRMYWRPVLNVYVMPDGQQRFAELDRLLDGSGLGVQRR